MAGTLSGFIELILLWLCHLLIWYAIIYYFFTRYVPRENCDVDFGESVTIVQILELKENICCPNDKFIVAIAHKRKLCHGPILTFRRLFRGLAQSS